MEVTNDNNSHWARNLLQGWWPILIIACLVASVLYQRWEYTHPARPAFLKRGEKLSDLPLDTLDGKAAHVSWAGERRGTIVYVFRPDCIWCKRNLDPMRVLAASNSGYRFLGVSTSSSGLVEYVKANQIKYPVYVASPGSKGIKELKISGTPETIVVQRDGTVEKIWTGAYAGDNGNQVQNMFGVKLPAVKDN